MSHFDSEGSSKPWNIPRGSEPRPSQTGFDRQEAPWKSLGTSMSAISFGFVATAILISMFLIMAIFEHLFRPNAEFSSSQNGLDSSLESRQMQKLGNPQTVPMAYAPDYSVVMPGQGHPTCIAKPAPLPCRREGADWPFHEHTFSVHRL